jgi:uncharacterized protein involved in copper resistance
VGTNPHKRLTRRGLHLQVQHPGNITRRPGPVTVQAAEVSTEIVTQALLRVHQATVVLRAVVLRAAVLATEVTVDHQAVDHQAVDHQAVDHQAADHQAADHQAADHQAADHQAVDHPLAVLVDMVGHLAVGRVVTVVPPAEVHQQEMLARARARLLLTAPGTVQQLVRVVADRDLPE